MDKAKLAVQIDQVIRTLHGVNCILGDAIERDENETLQAAPAFTAAEVIGHIEDIKAKMPRPEDADDEDFVRYRARTALDQVDRFKAIAVARLPGVRIYSGEDHKLFD